jgi:hypothetical protein
MLGAVAPGGPIIVEGAISVFLVVAFLIALGLLWVFRATLKPLLIWLADQADRIRLPRLAGGGHLLGPLSAALRSLADQIETGLTTLLNGTQGGITFFWNLIANQAVQLAEWTADFAETVEKALAHTTTVVVPKVIRTTITRVERVIEPTRVIVHKIEHVGTAATRAADVALGRRILSVRELADQALARLKRLERNRVAALTAGVLFAALARAGLGWVRCRNVKRLAKRACGMDATLLESLISDSLLFFGTFSLIEFAEELQGLTDDAADAIRRLTRVG